MFVATLLVLSTALLVDFEPAAECRPRTKINPVDGLSYVWIPPGNFLMGDHSCFAWEPTVHPVAVRKGYWIGATEVTQEAYQRVTGTNPSRYRGSHLPVDQISWHDARKYCQAVSMRLPTEAEWEYAARGGNVSARHGALEEIAWFDGNSADSTHEVGTKRPNAFGLYDTLGNVWEWVEDAYEHDPNKKILRGDSFFNAGSHVRVSDRLWALPDTAHPDMGIRCAGD